MKHVLKKRGVQCMALMLATAMLLCSCVKPPSSSSNQTVPSETRVFVPDVTHLDLIQAQAAAEKAGYIIQVSDTQWDDHVPKECVLSQSPLSSELAGDGGILRVILSKGPQTEFVSDVTNLDKKTAVAELEALGFHVECTEEYSDLAPGAVIRQDIAPGQALKRGGTIHLVISKGLENIDESKDVTVPSVAGKSFQDAKSILSKLGLYTIVEKKEYSATVSKDCVIAQKQAPGSKLRSGQTVAVTLSRGVEKVRMPDVQYKTRAQAEQLITAAKLTCKAVEEESDVIQAGNVIRQQEAPGLLLDTGTEVTVYISISKSVEMPSIGSITKAEAQQLLAKVKLVPSFVEVYDDDVASGLVIGQSPAPGIRLKIGTTVTITVSKGKEKVTVPDLRNKTSFEALQALEDLGLTYTAAGEFNDTVEDGRILSQTPAPGSKVDKGESVHLAISLGKEGANTVTVPNVAGKTRADAETQLRGAGLQVAIQEGYHDTVAAGKVISQDIPAGTIVNKNQLINLVISRGQEKTQMPQFVGFAMGPSFVDLSYAKLKSVIVEEYNADVPAGVVFYQSIPAQTEVVIWTTVTIKVSLGRKPIPVTGITLNKKSMTAEYAFTLTATVSPGNADDKTVTWSSSEPSVVTVSNGVVTLKKAGTAVVTASSGGKSDSCTVTVQQVSWRADDFEYTVSGREATITRFKGSVGENAGIVIPLSLGGARVTKIGEYAFSDFYNRSMYRAASIHVPDGVTEIGNSAFSDCTGIETVRLPSSLKKIGNAAFDDCKKIRTIQLPSGLQSLGMNAFYGCENLSAASIPASVTFIDANVFLGCLNMTAIAVDPANPSYCSKDGVLFNKSMTILMQAPHQLTGHYVVPAGVVTIKYQSMRNCPNLTAVTIPASVKTIENLAFAGSAIAAIYFEGNAPNASDIGRVSHPSPIVYYKAGKTGFGATWHTYQTQVY